MVVQKLFEIIRELVEAQEDAEKCEGGNASAGRRVRKASMNAIKELKTLRSIILEKNK